MKTSMKCKLKKKISILLDVEIAYLFEARPDLGNNHLLYKNKTKQFILYFFEEKKKKIFWFNLKALIKNVCMRDSALPFCEAVLFVFF